MPTNCQKAFETAAAKIMQLPHDYLNLKIKDNILREDDWDAVNTEFCFELGKVDCVIVESELDPYWSENKTFKDLLEYVSENCDCV